MTRVARAITVVALLCSVACVLVLHVVRSDVMPVARRLSVYAVGPYGWLMTTAFVALGCGLAALGFALLRSRPRGATCIIPVLGLVAGVGMILSAIYETAGGSGSSEVIHSRASITATIAVIVLVLVHSTPIARRWSDVSPDRAGVGLALAAAALAAVAPLLHDTRWSGLGQRLLWIVLLIWILRTMWTLPAREPREGG